MSAVEGQVDINSLSLLVEQRDTEKLLAVDVYWTFPPAIFFILDEDIRLTFRSVGQGTVLHEFHMSMGRRLQNVSGQPSFARFYSPLPQSVVDKIEKQRRGNDLVLSFSINNLTYVTLDRTTNTLGEVHRYFWSPTKTSEVKTYTAREWIENVLKKTGYGDRLFLEVPIAFPKLDTLSPSPTPLLEFRDRLIRAIAEVQRAHDDYLNYRNDNCVDRIREASDSLRTFLHDQTTLPDELLFATATCSKNIAPELFQSLINMVDAIFAVGSKGPHAVTKRDAITKRDELMDYRPDFEDAELLIGTMSAIVAYLARKLEKRSRS